MGLRITGSTKIENNLQRATSDAADSLEKLSSGETFSRRDPQPAERALSDTLNQKLRQLTARKRIANDAVSLVETADSALNEIGNITNRMQELATQASSPSLSDKERKFIFVEYEALREEIDRIATETKYNGLSLLSQPTGEESRAENLQFRIGESSDPDSDEDFGLALLSGFSDIVAQSENLGIQSVKSFLLEDGISLEDLESIFSSDISNIGEVFFDAISKISGFRTSFGALSSRMSHTLTAIDIASENIAASQSRIRDVDYATEVSNLTKANILVQAGTSLLAQASLPAQLVLTLIKNLD
jgi:flagellin